jgi:hypothetical protein
MFLNIFGFFFLSSHIINIIGKRGKRKKKPKQKPLNAHQNFNDDTINIIIKILTK